MGIASENPHILWPWISLPVQNSNSKKNRTNESNLQPSPPLPTTPCIVVGQARCSSSCCLYFILSIFLLPRNSWNSSSELIQIRLYLRPFALKRLRAWELEERILLWRMDLFGKGVPNTCLFTQSHFYTWAFKLERANFLPGLECLDVVSLDGSQWNDYDNLLVIILTHLHEVAKGCWEFELSFFRP